MLSDEESKAVQEIAKTTGKGIDAASAMGSFLSKYIGGPLSIAVGIASDHLSYVRWERQERLMLRADNFMKQHGLNGPTRAVPLKLAIPLLQSATIEEDDYLQDRYAMLLVNASNAGFGADIRRSYVSMLDELTALDVANLEAIYALPYEEGRKQGVITSGLPQAAHLCVEKENLVEPTEEITLSLGNLARLGFIRTGATWGGIDIYTTVRPTVLGRSFTHACAPPKAP